MMLLHLLKKDFMLVRRSALLMLLVMVVLPPIMVWRLSFDYDDMEVVLFIQLFAPLFVVVVMMNYLFAKEGMYRLAGSLLAATPYPRSLLVLSKYIFCPLVYVVCCLIIWLESLLISGLGDFSFPVMAFVFTIFAVLCGVYLPLAYKFGYEKMGIIFAFFIVALPLVWLNVVDMLGEYNGFFANLPLGAMVALALVLGVVFWAVSALLSVKIYNSRDLA